MCSNLGNSIGFCTGKQSKNENITVTIKLYHIVWFISETLPDFSSYDQCGGILMYYFCIFFKKNVNAITFLV